MVRYCYLIILRNGNTKEPYIRKSFQFILQFRKGYKFQNIKMPRIWNAKLPGMKELNFGKYRKSLNYQSWNDNSPCTL
jgi:hypothetical protein